MKLSQLQKARWPVKTWLSNWPDDLVGAQEVLSCNVMAASSDWVRQSRRWITEPWQIKESVSAEGRERVLIVLECFWSKGCSLLDARG